jgi:ketosteroid isomerase-like protein
MPWLPELFSAPVLAQFEAKQKRKVVDVPYFDGLVAGEIEALVDSFAGEPRIYHPLRGEVRGETAFREFVADTELWLGRNEARVEDIQRSVLDRRGFEEVIVHLEDEGRRLDLSHAMVADHSPEGRIEEIRIYFGTRLLTGHPTVRAPLLRADAHLRQPPQVAAYGRALTAGDAAAVAAAFADDASAREPDGPGCVHVGRDQILSFYAGQLDAGGIELEPCVLVEDGATCALEYNVSSRDGTGAVGKRAGFSVFVLGDREQISRVRIYEELAVGAAA